MNSNVYNRSIFIKNLWRWKCGLPEDEGEPKNIKIDLDKLKQTEWSSEFEKLMRNRLLMGGIRYGIMGHGSIPKGKPKYDRIASIKKRLQLFEETKNAEMLVDIANMCLLIFEEKSVDGLHFSSIDDGYHDTIMK